MKARLLLLAVQAAILVAYFGVGAAGRLTGWSDGT